MEEYKCKYCGKICKNANSLRNHERLCKENPNHQVSSIVEYNMKNHGHPAWNKGLTKETDERVRRYGESYSKGVKSGKIIPWVLGKTKETDERIALLSKKVSDSVNERVKRNEWHKSLGKKKRVEYKGIMLDSSWEVIVAEYLDEHNIKWEQPTNGFEYILDGVIHKYYPDFYIPSIDKYIEVKGYERRKDLVKYKVVDNLIIIKYKEIQQILRNEFSIEF